VPRDTDQLAPMVFRLATGYGVSTSVKPLRLLSRHRFRHPLVLRPVCPVRVLCAVQVESKHFAAPDTVLSQKMLEQVMNRNGPAADGKAFACHIPPECDWALEWFVRKLNATTLVV
jgi:hypothetical protein